MQHPTLAADKRPAMLFLPNVLCSLPGVLRHDQEQEKIYLRYNHSALFQKDGTFAARALNAGMYDSNGKDTMGSH